MLRKVLTGLALWLSALGLVPLALGPGSRLWMRC